MRSCRHIIRASWGSESSGLSLWQMLSHVLHVKPSIATHMCYGHSPAQLHVCVIDTHLYSSTHKHHLYLHSPILIHTSVHTNTYTCTHMQLLAPTKPGYSDPLW